MFLLSFSFFLSHATGDEYLEGVLYIKQKDNASHPKSNSRVCKVYELLQNEKQTLIKEYAIKEYAQHMRVIGSDYLNNVYRIEFDSIQLTDQLIEELRNNDQIELVERVPAYTISLPEQDDPINMYLIHNSLKDESEGTAGLPNDFYWGAIDNIQTSWFWDMVGFADVYGKYTASPDVKVAVVDNAVWDGHEDMEFSYDNLFDTFVGVEGNSAPPKWVTDGETAYQWSHGTHCAGLIGAITNNGVGMSSLGSGVTLMGVKTAESSALDLARSIQGVIWAAENGARIISMSFGSNYYSQIEEAVFKSCIEKGIVLIAAAGNNSSSDYYYPAHYEGVISVASVNSDWKKSSFSNYGPWVDIAAPGGFYVNEAGEIDPLSQILSATYCTNQTLKPRGNFSGKYYDMMSGTSMATPVVSSLASLILSYYPLLNSFQMLEVLQRSAVQVNPADLPIYDASGVINAPAAMQLLEDTKDKCVQDLQASLNLNAKEVCLVWSRPEEQSGLLGYQIYENGKLLEPMVEGLSYRHSVSSEASLTNDYGVKALYDEGDGLTAYVKPQRESSIGEIEFADTPVDYFLSPSGSLFLKSEKDIDTVSVYDIQGRLAVQTKYTSGGIDLSFLSRGVYIVKLRHQDGEESFKLIL